MWDNAPLLKNIADTLIVFSVLAILYGAAYYTVHLPGLFPLRSVQLSMAPQRVATAEMLKMVRSETRGNFFTVNIDHVRQSFEKLPWVRSVGIRREFPHGLIVQIEEHQALARWNNAALVNQYGEVFEASSEQDLPDFSGPDGSSVEVAQRYTEFSRQIAPLNLQLMQLALSARYAWQMRLNNGMVLELGREDMPQRLARFVAVMIENRSARKGSADGDSAAAQGLIRSQVAAGATYVDLRYRNGFAVRQRGRG
jgi:cell division protein FtsQ